jgi:hypothetical protein
MRKRKFYKYRTLYAAGSTKVHRFTKSIFKKAELFYARPSSFNDPFDCNLRMHVEDSTDADWEAYLDAMALRSPSRAPRLMAMKAAKEWRTNPAIGAGIGANTLKDHYDLSSVLCLARKGNSIPMFSYYADSHRGIAIEFTFSYEEVPCGYPFGNGAIPYGGSVLFDVVKYPKGFPELNYHRLYGTEAMVKNLLFTKAPEWSHEKEFRIVRRKVPQGNVSFDRKLLTRVIFGCATTAKDIGLVKDWLKGWPSKVVLSKAKQSSDKFELHVEDFDEVMPLSRSRTKHASRSGVAKYRPKRVAPKANRKP